jgi:AAHS family 4-hydroxybenzoate transporter-like MFS transporter
MTTPRDDTGSVNIRRLLDEGPWTGFQKGVVVLASLGNLIDGMAILILGVAIPALMKTWHLNATAFAVLTAGGLTGMGIGTTFAGIMGDRVGRKPCILFSMVLFGTMTAASALAPGVTTLGILRFFSGLGLGGVLPNLTSMIAEYTPIRHRKFAVALGSTSSQVGGVLVGLIAATVLTTLGWKALFIIGGAIPLIFALILAIKLPESAQFLLHKPRRQNQLAAILRRLRYDGFAYYGRPESLAVEPPTPATSLLSPKLRRNTLMLWGAFFGCYFAVFLVPTWLPTMLSMEGFGLRTTSSGMAAYNFGGLLGGILAGWAVDKFGSRRPMLALGIGGVIWALLLIPLISITKGNTPLTTLVVGCQGIFILGIMVSLIAYAATIYPTSYRATGVGIAFTFARVGAVLSAFLGPLALSRGGVGIFFGLIALAMGISTIFIAFTRAQVSESDETRDLSGLLTGSKLQGNAWGKHEVR